MYSNNIVNFQASTTILNAYTKKSGNLLKTPRIFFSFFDMYDLFNMKAIFVEYKEYYLTHDWGG